MGGGCDFNKSTFVMGQFSPGVWWPIFLVYWWDNPAVSKFNPVIWQRIPKHNTNIIKYTVSLAGLKIWNSMATNIQNMSHVIFKQYVKTVLNGEIVVN